jgi:hypothetical protein
MSVVALALLACLAPAQTATGEPPATATATAAAEPPTFEFGVDDLAPAAAGETYEPEDPRKTRAASLRARGQSDDELDATPEGVVTSTAAEKAAEEIFVKGELAHAGSLRIVPDWSFVGVRLGALLQETTFFAQVAPKLDLQLMDGLLTVGLDAPLNLEVYALEGAADDDPTTGGFAAAGRLRKRDWDEARDFVKILRYLTYGRKEDNLFLSVGQVFANTLGHGQSMRRYQANLDVDQSRIGLELDAYGDLGGFEFMLADVTRGNLFAVLGFVKPLAPFLDGVTARSLSLGVHFASDRQAPAQLRRGAAIGAAPIGPVLTDAVGAPLADREVVSILGVDAELKLLKTRGVDLKTYVDFSHLKGAGSGVALGLLGRFNLRVGRTLHLFRTRIEGRRYDANFVPSYFDTLYEYQKFQFELDPGTTTADFSTKLAHVRGRTGAPRLGAYLEAAYALPGWITLAAAYETDSERQDRHLMLHVEVPLQALSLFATYHQRNLQRFFTLGPNDLVFAGARLQLLPFFFLNGRVQKSFEWDPALFSGLGGYARSLNYQLDGEVGVAF